MSTTVPKPDMRVVGVGLGRTGTLSLREALNILGVGPCYHMTEVFKNKDHITLWRNVGRGIEPTENLYKIFANYQSGCDYPQACYPEELQKAFPDAKFILTVRDPEKWKVSVENTILKISKQMYIPSFFSPFANTMYTWTYEMMWGPEGQFQGDFENNAVQKFNEHTEKCKRVIPPEQLLVYQVGEGWEKLCDFLGVPVPDQPFPRVNDTASFQNAPRKGMSAPVYIIVRAHEMVMGIIGWVASFFVGTKTVKKE